MQACYLGLGPPIINANPLPIKSPLRTGPRPLGMLRSSFASCGDGNTTELRGLPLERPISLPLPRAMPLLCRRRTWRE